MKRYSIRLNDRELEVELSKREGSELSFLIEGESYQVNVAPILEELAVHNSATAQPTRQPTRTTAKPSAPIKNSPKVANQNATTAPMPGIVVSILVKEGTQIEIGATILVMEAMKMENNITAHRSGIVRKIHVKAGQEVENGQSLIEIE